MNAMLAEVTGKALIAILVLAFVLLVVFWLVRQFIKDGAMQMVVGLILGVILLVYALNKLGLMSF